MPIASAEAMSTGDVVGLCLVVVCFLGIATFNVWFAVRTWRDVEQFSRTASILSTKVGDAVGRGLARGVAVVGAASVCLACFVFAGLAGMASANPGVWKWVAGAFVAVAVAAVPLLAVIVVFNRPRFLIVPYMRELDRATIRGGSPSLRERLEALEQRTGWRGHKN